MRVRILSVFAAMSLLAACETAPQTTAATSGAGAGTGAGTGAQATVAPGSQQDLVVNVGDRVFFDFDKYNLKPEAQAALQKQAAWLKRYPNVRIQIAGNCDERGTREYNLALGERRANSAKDYLVSLGISPDRMRTISYGKSQALDMGHDEAAWAKNRRAQFLIIEK